MAGNDWGGVCSQATVSPMTGREPKKMGDAGRLSEKGRGKKKNRELGTVSKKDLNAGEESGTLYAQTMNGTRPEALKGRGA